MRECLRALRAVGRIVTTRSTVPDSGCVVLGTRVCFIHTLAPACAPAPSCRHAPIARVPWPVQLWFVCLGAAGAGGDDEEQGWKELAPVVSVSSKKKRVAAAEAAEDVPDAQPSSVKKVKKAVKEVKF